MWYRSHCWGHVRETGRWFRFETVKGKKKFSKCFLQHASSTEALFTTLKWFPLNIYSHLKLFTDKCIREQLWHADWAARDQTTNFPISRWRTLTPKLYSHPWIQKYWLTRRSSPQSDSVALCILLDVRVPGLLTQCFQFLLCHGLVFTFPALLC